jgi:hypothetical protein
MRKATIVLPLIASGLGVLFMAAPASAADTADTVVTFAITGGGLSISAPTGTVAITPVTASASAQTVNTDLGNVVVTDLRGATTGWVATVKAADFVNGSITVPAAAAAYTSANATVGGTVSIAHTDRTPMATTLATVQTATSVSGANSGTWDPNIAVTIPAGALVGTYTSTVVHAVT